MISAIHKFRKNILASSRNISETQTRSYFITKQHDAKGWKVSTLTYTIFWDQIIYFVKEKPIDLDSINLFNTQLIKWIELI